MFENFFCSQETGYTSLFRLRFSLKILHARFSRKICHHCSSRKVSVESSLACHFKEGKPKCSLADFQVF